MDEYKDRLLSAMKRVNMTTQQLADKIGISYQAVKKVIDGKSAGFGIINNVRAADVLQVNSNWLVTGSGEMAIFTSPNSSQTDKMPVEIDLEGNPNYPAIRRVKFKLSAGASGFGVEYRDDEGSPIVFQRAWYQKHGLLFTTYFDLVNSFAGSRDQTITTYRIGTDSSVKLVSLVLNSYYLNLNYKNVTFTFK